MVCGRCGKVFDETKQDYCGFCRPVHTEKGEPIRDLKGILRYITAKFGKEILLDNRRADALIADFFRRKTALLRRFVRRLREEAVRGAREAV